MEESAVDGGADAPEVLWAPSAEMVEGSPLTRYIRWLADTRELDFEDYHALWRWSTTEIEEFWRTIWEHFEVIASGEGRELGSLTEVVLTERVMPGADWFPGTRLNYAEHIFRGKADDEVALVYASELRELSDMRWGELRDRVAAVPGGTPRPRGDHGRPRGRLPAERPGGGHRLPGRGQPRRHLVELLTRFRPGQRRRPLRADRAEGDDLRGRLPLRRQGLRPPRDDRRDRRTDPQPRAHRRGPLPECFSRALGPLRAGEGRRADDLGSAPGPRPWGRPLLRARPLRPPPLGPLLLRHHRPAEGDRPRARRHPARAAQEGLPPPRRQNRGPRLLVHDDRLDDVELPGRRAPHPGLDRALRRQSGHTGHGRPLGPRRAHRDDLLRHQRRLHRRLHEGRRELRRAAATSLGFARSDRRARRSPPRASNGSTTTSAPIPGCSRPAAAPISARPSSAACRSSPSTRASSRAAPWAPRSRPSTRTATR